jgi:hypothetical protein
VLGSPTQEQWAAFQRQRRPGSTKAAAAAQVSLAGPTTSCHFAAEVAATTGPDNEPGGLLARLKAALQPEPSINELLDRCAVVTALSGWVCLMLPSMLSWRPVWHAQGGLMLGYVCLRIGCQQ